MIIEIFYQNIEDWRVKLFAIHEEDWETLLKIYAVEKMAGAWEKNF